MLLSFGSNGSGQLGIGNFDDASTPSPCHFAPDTEIGPGAPCKIAAGGNHTLVLFSDGDLYVAGRDENASPHDRNPVGMNAAVFKLIQIQKSRSNVKLCAATWEASIILTKDDCIYSWGIGDKGELGLGKSKSHVKIPQEIPSFLPPSTRIVDIASCISHTVAILSNGDVYGWGNGRKGQLGEPSGLIWSPRKIESLCFPVVRAVCGREFTYLVGNSERGEHTVIGSNKWNVRSSAPTAIPGWSNIIASWGSIFVLDITGRLTSWGRDDHGQLAPKALPLIEKIAAGSEHIVALSRSGSIFAWGWGEHGNCGPSVERHGEVKDSCNIITTPTNIIFPTIIGVGAGCATSWLYTF